MVNPARGVLYPERLPELHRLPPTPDAAGLVAWCWIPEWDIEPGRVSRQEIVSYPALNLVVEQDGVALVGATTRAAHRDLEGRGWAVGVLLRPAAVPAFTEAPAQLVDRSVPLDEPGLHDRIVAEMASGEGHRERAAAALCGWLVARAGGLSQPQSPARQANAMADLLMTDATVRTPEQAATRLAVSVRTLQRLAHRHVGLPPAAMIRRRRLQEAAERIRLDPSTDLATIAADLGYADQAHLANDFRSVLGFTPSAYRRQAAPQ